MESLWRSVAGSQPPRLLAGWPHPPPVRACPGLVTRMGEIRRPSPILLKSEGALSDGPPTHPRPGISEQRKESRMPHTAQ